MFIVNLVRGVALVEGVIAGALAITTLCLFAKRQPPAALTSHVRWVTATHQGFVAFGVVTLILRFGDPFGWEEIALLATFTLAILAQVPLVRYERAAVRCAKEQSE